MPNIVVQVVPGLSEDAISELAGRIAEAGNAAFGLPTDRVNIYFDQSPHYRGGVYTKSIADKSEAQPPTTTFWVNTTAGKSLEQKRVLVTGITAATVELVGGTADDVVIYINEETLTNVAKNGKLFADK